MKPDLDSLDDQLVASLFVIGFDGYELPRQTAELLGGGLAGVTLFRRNIADRIQLTELCLSIREAARPSGLVPIIAVDQEGGRVQRLRHVGRLYDAARDQTTRPMPEGALAPNPPSWASTSILRQCSMLIRIRPIPSLATGIFSGS